MIGVQLPMCAEDLRAGMVVDLLNAVEQFGGLHQDDVINHDSQYALAIVVEDAKLRLFRDGSKRAFVATDQGDLFLPCRFLVTRHCDLEDDFLDAPEPHEIQGAIDSILQHYNP